MGRGVRGERKEGERMVGGTYSSDWSCRVRESIAARACREIASGSIFAWSEI